MDRKIVEKDANEALKIINSKDKTTYNKYCSIYPFTTENIAGYFNKENIENKDILTVGSSGDHVFNAKLFGAKSIEIFDINKLSKYYVILKNSGIKCLNYECFLDFFVKNKFFIKQNKNAFNIEIYKYFRDDLPDHIRLFWDILFAENNRFKLRNSPLFYEEIGISEIKGFNNYLKEENFYTLKNNIDNTPINFLDVNIKNLPNCLNKSFDTIYLSNIYECLFEEKEPLKALRNIIYKLNKSLKNDGKIYIAYIYNVVSCYYGEKYIYKSKQLENLYNLFQNCETKSFTSASLEGQDEVLIYKKYK